MLAAIQKVQLYIHNYSTNIANQNVGEMEMWNVF